MPTVGIPEGAKTYRVGPNNYVVYDISKVVESIKKPLYLSWQIFGEDEWERITQQRDFTEGVDHHLHQEAWDRMGVIDAGVSEELTADMQEHPWRRFVADLDEQAELRPWLRDKEFIEIGAEAYLEGREVSESEFKKTDWYRNATQRQRDWMELAHTQPEDAEEQLLNVQRDLRNTFQQRGWKGDPNLIARYYAKQFVQGDLTESELQDRVLHETDPFTRGASPFAGYYPGENDEVVEYNGQRYLKDESGNYWTVGGPGQTARLGNPSMQFDQDLDVEPAGNLRDFFEQREGPAHTALGNVEYVREQYRRWLGPHADNVSEDTIGQWAHKIRTNEHAKDQLTEFLRGQRLTLFPDHENPDLTWQDISEPWKAVYRRFAGHLPDDDDPLFMDIVKTNDFTKNQEKLLNEGMEKGWQPVMEQFTNDAGQALGTSHRPDVQSRQRQLRL